MRWLVVAACLLVVSCERRVEEPSRTTVRPERSAVAVTDTARVEGLKLELLEAKSGCVVRSDGAAPSEFALTPKPPCYFLRRNGTQPQTFSFPDIGVRSVLIVVGSAASDESRKKWNLPPAMVCGEETQAVLFRREKLVVTAAVHRGGVTCKDTGADEKEFWAFAHDEQ